MQTNSRGALAGALFLLSTIAPFILCDVRFTSPPAGASLQAGQTLIISWNDSKESVSLDPFASYSLFLCAGGDEAESQVSLDRPPLHSRKPLALEIPLISLCTFSSKLPSSNQKDNSVRAMKFIQSYQPTLGRVSPTHSARQPFSLECLESYSPLSQFPQDPRRNNSWFGKHITFRSFLYQWHDGHLPYCCFGWASEVVG